MPRRRNHLVCKVCRSSDSAKEPSWSQHVSKSQRRPLTDHALFYVACTLRAWTCVHADGRLPDLHPTMPAPRPHQAHTLVSGAWRSSRLPHPPRTAGSATARGLDSQPVSLLLSQIARALWSTVTRPAGQALLLCALSLSGCPGDDDTAGNTSRDGSFGEPAPGYPSDAGLDGGAGLRDGGGSGGPVIRVRFVHGIPNSGALLVCHDPDGAGPIAAYPLEAQGTRLRADYGTRSVAISLASVTSGTITLQREPKPRASDAGAAPADDAGEAPSRPDGGAVSWMDGLDDACGEATREASIALPIVDPLLDDARLRLLPSLAGGASVTLVGSGVALEPKALAPRAEAERAALQAGFGARALVQLDPVFSDAATFSLSVLHAIPDVPPGAGTLDKREVGALRLCITAGTRNNTALPKPPLPGIVFRARTPIDDVFDARLSYEFRVFAQSDFDAARTDCATTSLMPVAKGSYSKFQAGHAYTLALFGAIAPNSLCSANDVSIVRASCSPPAAELGARLLVLED